jgi:hypothetical protein
MEPLNVIADKTHCDLLASPCDRLGDVTVLLGES